MDETLTITDDCKVKFNTNYAYSLKCECGVDIAMPVEKPQCVLVSRAVQEGWYITEKGEFLCPKCCNLTP